MKRIIAYITCCAIGTLLLVSCDKYLSTDPEFRATIDNPESMSELLVNAYPNSNYMPFMEAMSDNVTEIPELGLSLSNTEAYMWEPVSSTGSDSQLRYWERCYRAISVANLALETIANHNNPQDYTAQKGEALLARAYAHHMLVSLFSKMYNPATANSDPGIPYVTEPENVVIKQYERETVAYVYEMIENDILQGLPLIDDKSYIKPAFHFNFRAAHAFACRFYLFKKDWEKAIYHAEVAFPNKGYDDYLRPWATTWSGMSGAAMREDYFKATNKANLLLVEAISGWTSNYMGNRYVTAESLLMPLISASRGNLIGTDMVYLTSGGSNGAARIYKMARFFKAASPNSNLGNYYMTLPLLTTEEVLFNQAEAHAMLGDTTNVLINLNKFIAQRIQNYTPARRLTRDKIMARYYPNAMEPYEHEPVVDAFVQAVLELKRPEFMHEGLRWFDNLRHDMTIVHVRDRGQTVDVLEPGDPRRVVQLPPLSEQNGLEPNP